MELSALVFDVDGTLADTEHAGHRAAFNAAFAEAGPRATRADLSGAVAVLTDLAGTTLARLTDLHARATGSGPRPPSPASQPGPAHRRST
jgi:phosphoglycolate phosphatase-like HAD superfamily hydrolase